MAKDKITKLLLNHPGRLHIANDTWTSPNHRAFCAWTVHLQHDGQPLTFLLDIVELAESHTGVALATATQNMLTRFGIQDKILALNADNASANDRQTAELDRLQNAFNEINQLRCFNHSMQLSAVELVKPFNAGMGKAALKGPAEADENDEAAANIESEDDDDETDGDENENDNDGDDGDSIDDPEDDTDELASMDDEEREELLEQTASVREAVSKVSVVALHHLIV